MTTTTAIVVAIIVLAIVGKAISTRRATPATRGAVAGAVPSTEPTGWSAFTCWCKKYENALWLGAEWTALILIVGFLTGEWWWSKVLSGVGLFTIAAFTLFGSGGAPGLPFRHKLATIGIWFFIGTSAWVVFGKDWWAKYEAEEAVKKAVAAESAKPVNFDIEAPVGKPSVEEVDTRRGARIEPEGLIWIVDQNGVQYESGNDREYTSPPIVKARFQSRTTEPVKVRITVSR
ncbi:MAG TPA: hypothetical protein VJC13_02505 [Candidatus Paceibacterota bacterium]